MLNIRLDGFDDLQKELTDAQNALQSLHGQLDEVRFNPDSQEDIDRAIRDTERLIDSKVARFRNNSIVQTVVSSFKEAVRKEILERADKARQGSAVRNLGQCPSNAHSVDLGRREEADSGVRFADDTPIGSNTIPTTPIRKATTS